MLTKTNPHPDEIKNMLLSNFMHFTKISLHGTIENLIKIDILTFQFYFKRAQFL